MVRFQPLLSKKSGKALQHPRWSTPIRQLVSHRKSQLDMKRDWGASFTLSGSFLKDQLEILVFETRRSAVCVPYVVVCWNVDTLNFLFCA